MPIAAVPRYLGSDFASASPALRFGMYLKLWGVDSRSGDNLWKTHDVDYRRTGRDRTERRFEDENKTSALGAATALNPFDRKSAAACARRQQAIFRTIAGGNGLELVATSVAPFTTGLGNEHPLENGFAFLNPYGLPYLPGSGVKGVVRRAAEELAHRDFFGNDSGWTLPMIWHLFGFEPWLVSEDRWKDTEWKEWVEGFSVSQVEIKAYLDAVIDKTLTSHKKLKGCILEARDPLRTLLRKRQLHVRGALEFWDVVPQINGNNLTVEIMTPHYSHYYQGKSVSGSTSSHDSGQPNPISFLAVPPGSSFTFHVVCNRERLARVAPDIAENGRWKTLLKDAFSPAYEWLGFGAKTAVGYGAMKPGYGAMEPDPRAEEAERKREEEEAERRVRQEEERQRQEAEKEEADRRQAEQAAFDALPEGRKRIIELERTLAGISSRGHLDERLRNEAKGQANRLAKTDVWSDTDERKDAAELLERVYEVIGWHDPGRNRRQRERQEKRKRDIIACIRGG